MSAPLPGTPGKNPVSITLSFDLELEIGRATTSQLQRLDALTPDLVALLDHYQLAATWAVADPGRSAATEVILSSSQPHEIAVLGDRSWLGWGAGGSRSNRELARRITGAAARQIGVRTLVLHNESSFANGLPLAELGICSIRQPIGHEVLRPVALAGLAKGVRIAERVQRLILPRWWNWFEAESQFDVCAYEGNSYHFGLDAQHLCVTGTRALPRLSSVLDELSRLRDHRGVQIQTLRDWTTVQIAPERRAA